MEELSNGVWIVLIGWELNKLWQFEVLARFPPLSYGWCSFIFTSQFKLLLRNSTLLIFQLKVVSSIVDTCSRINSGFRTISLRWFWISNLFSVISSFSYFYCSIYFSFTVSANSSVFHYYQETEINHQVSLNRC